MYVSNLGFHTSDDDLRKLFEPFGQVSSAKVITDRETGRSRGFGFVEMANSTEVAERATPIPSQEVLERVEQFTREPFPDDSEALKPGTARRRALERGCSRPAGVCSTLCFAHGMRRRRRFASTRSISGGEPVAVAADRY